MSTPPIIIRTVHGIEEVWYPPEQAAEPAQHRTSSQATVPQPAGACSPPSGRCVPDAAVEPNGAREVHACSPVPPTLTVRQPESAG
jgi:hypothetical protein